MGQRRRWWIGLVPLLALWIGVNKFAIGDVEADLTRRADAALAQATGDRGFSAAAEGRDVTIDGLVLDRSARTAALDAVAHVHGVRRVTDARSEPALAPPIAALNAQAGATEAPAAPEPAHPPAPPMQTAAPAPPKAEAPEAEPDPRLCRDRLATLMQASPIHFEYNRPDIDPESYETLDAAAAILQQCPKVKFSVAGHWRNDRLALGRAENAIARLLAAGIERGRLTAVAAGESRPDAPEEERATDHHLEFKLR